MDLTGAPYRDIRLKDADVQTQLKDGSLWSYLCVCDLEGYIMSLSTSGTDIYSASGEHGSLPTGLVPGHAYTLLTAVTTKSGHQLAKVLRVYMCICATVPAIMCYILTDNIA